MEARPQRAWVRRWRVRAAAAATLLAAMLAPKAAWARTIQRVASREEERTAAFVTLGVIALLFVVAYFNSKKEDTSEDSRIKSEVERLVRLKKEFEEAEAGEEGTDDDSMMASLRAAQQKIAAEKGKEEEEAAKEGEKPGEGEAKEEGKEGGKEGEGKDTSSKGSKGGDAGEDGKGEGSSGDAKPKED